MHQIEGSKWVGKFNISLGKDIYGEVTLAGPETCLRMQDENKFDPHAISDRCVRGVLQDLTKVTLIDCVLTSGPGTARRGEESYHFATFFPHYVVYGEHHVSPSEKTIAEVHLVLDDAPTLFYDFDAFGSVIDARPFIETIANANRLNRPITIGPNPEVLYFTGKREIFAAETTLGRISAFHNPALSLGGPRGVRLDNIIAVAIAFREPMLFEHAMLHTSTLTRYLGMLVGRPQNLLKLSVRMRSDPDTHALNVYWAMPPIREASDQERKPHPMEVLVDPVRQTESFSRVLVNWFDRHQERQAARGRFFDSFAEQNRYNTDRLIGAANMFDILRASAVPADVPISSELTDARENARRLFRDLPNGPERDSVLNALGRVGKANLKQKVRHRALLINNAVGEKFPDLITVTDEAINCRNYYVHGGKCRFDYDNHFDTIVFFIDTLEFVFAASDLIDAGWDIKAWSTVPTAGSHPFGRFRISYGDQLKRLKDLLRDERD